MAQPFPAAQTFPNHGEYAPVENLSAQWFLPCAILPAPLLR
jgi:hypothetical protein